MGIHSCRQGALGLNTASCAKGTCHLGNVPSLHQLCVVHWLHVAALPALHGHCCSEHGSSLRGRCEMALMRCAAGLRSSQVSVLSSGDVQGQAGWGFEWSAGKCPCPWLGAGIK